MYFLFYIFFPSTDKQQNGLLKSQTTIASVYKYNSKP